MLVTRLSVKSSEVSEQRGYDAGKKINGRKRHVLVDTLGLILLVMVLPANIQDRDGAKQLLSAFFARATRPRLKLIWADGGYAGSLLEWGRQLWRCAIQIVKRTDSHGFKVLPRLEIVGYAETELQKASDDYLAVEKSNKGSNKDTVLVSVDSIAALRKAYPNYFLDTNFFSTLAATAVRE